MDPAPPPALAPDAHKGSAGRVLAVAGSRTMPGAAVLLARAAQRAGAGLVRVACLDAELLTVVPVGAPEAVLLDLTETSWGTAAAAHPALAPLEEAHALVAGPGLGRSARTTSVVAELLAAAPGRPRVLDADALFAFAGAPEGLRAARGPLVLTPHPGEAGRLLGRAIPADDEGRARCATELARAAGAIVCLKGRHSVVTDGERVHVNRTGNPGMATAGTGDVLAGVLAAFLARTVALEGGLRDALAPVVSAVWVHGRAGDLAAAARGVDGLIASDLVETVPRALDELRGG